MEWCGGGGGGGVVVVAVVAWVFVVGGWMVYDGSEW